MSVFAIYQNEDGSLVSWTTDPTKVASASILTARGYSMATLPDGSQINGVWDPVNHVFNPGPQQPAYLDAGDFISLLTSSEVVRIYSAAQLPNPTSPQMFQLLKQLENHPAQVNAIGPGLIQLVQLIKALGFFDDQAGVPGAPTARIAALRAAALAGVSS